MRSKLVMLLLLAAGCGSDAGSDADPSSGGAGAATAGVSAGGGVSGGGAPQAVGGAAGASGAGGAGNVTGGQAGASGSSASGSGGATPGGAGAGGGSASGGGGVAGAGGALGGAAGAGGALGGAAGAGGSGGSGVVFPPNCSCLNLGPPECAPTGNISFTLSRSASPTADEQSAYDAITCAMTGAVAYYNCNTSITKQLSVSYVPSVATADSNFNGSIRFGKERSYMVCATSMHEVAHALGVGTAPNWSKVSKDGLFNGENAIAQLRAITGKADDVVHSDTQHFWPYGLNYASEAKSTADLIDHCLMVTAIRKDLGL